MIEGCRFPSGSRMANSAVMRMIAGDVVWISNPLVVGLVAGVTIGGSVVVTPAYMAERALDNAMRSGQRETGLIMINNGRSPGVSGVAD